MPRRKTFNVPLPSSFEATGSEIRTIIAKRSSQRLSKHLQWLMEDIKSLPEFAQKEACRALNRFVRLKRPLPPDIAAMEAFQISEDPLPWDQLQPGDIVFTRPNPAIIPGFLWAMHYSHVGIYVRPGWMMEANVDKGVRLCELSRWQGSHAHMGFARLKPQFLATIPNLEAAMDLAAKNWANDEIRYNLAMWKEAGTNYGRSYCSELVWMVYEELGLDLRDDPRTEAYIQWVEATFGDWAARVFAESALAPDELALSSKIEFYAIGRSPSQPILPPN